MVDFGVRLYFALWKHINFAANKIGLTFKQAQTLIFLRYNPGVTMTAIVKEIG